MFEKLLTQWAGNFGWQNSQNKLRAGTERLHEAKAALSSTLWSHFCVQHQHRLAEWRELMISAWLLTLAWGSWTPFSFWPRKGQPCVILLFSLLHTDTSVFRLWCGIYQVCTISSREMRDVKYHQMFNCKLRNQASDSWKDFCYKVREEIA